VADQRVRSDRRPCELLHMRSRTLSSHPCIAHCSCVFPDRVPAPRRLRARVPPCPCAWIAPWRADFSVSPSVACLTVSSTWRRMWWSVGAMWQGDALCRSTDERAAGAVQRASSAAARGHCRSPALSLLARTAFPILSLLHSPSSLCLHWCSRSADPSPCWVVRAAAGWLMRSRRETQKLLAARCCGCTMEEQGKEEDGACVWEGGGTTVDWDASTQLIRSCSCIANNDVQPAPSAPPLQPRSRCLPSHTAARSSFVHTLTLFLTAVSFPPCGNPVRSPRCCGG
jgi:hypothetical protein